MMKQAKIFVPDTIKTQICQAIRRDLSRPAQTYGQRQDSTMMLRKRQVDELDKKYVSSSGNESQRLTAFLKFLEVNLHMADYVEAGLDLPDASYKYPQSRYEPRVNILLRARAMCAHVLSPFTEDEWFQHCKHGTGSSIGVSFSDTSLEAKSQWPISVSSRVASLFDTYLDFDWMSKSALLNFNRANPTTGRYVIQDSSRATTVPKNTTIDRMIAVEPTGNMFFQQGLMAMMYDRMRRCGLDLSALPTQHQKRARDASINRREATIDWSSASDCLSTDLLRWLLPPKWFDCCELVRSRQILIEGEPVELNMFSTMGNAVTFPLETLVFWSFAQACRLEIEGQLTHFPDWEDRLACSVFGDDCIVPTEVAPLFIEMMETLGFICNEEKSFYGDENFRESCGGDYLHGNDVRPFYLKGPHNNRLSALEPWLYIIANRLIPKYISCFGKRDYVYEKEFFRVWFGYFEEHKLQLRLVPPLYPDDSGLHVTEDIARLLANYPAKLCRIGRDDHGSYNFRFLRFQYRRNRRRIEELHYATWLRLPGGERGPWWEEKKIGGYVVAKGKSGHWSLPSKLC